MTTSFFDDFNSLGLDPSKWYMMTKQWGVGNNGLVMENITFSQLHLLLGVHGDDYSGSIPGCRKVDMRYPRVEPSGKPVSGKRCGAGVATKFYFASGRYEWRAKVLNQPGTWFAAGTYQYVETDTESGVVATTDDVNIQVMFEKGAFYALLSCYEGTGVTTQKVPLPMITPACQDFHTYRFDWHTQDPHPPAGQNPRRVDFYVDDTLLYTMTTTIPTKAGRFMMATLCPVEAGPAPFNEARVPIDWARVTPFFEAGDEHQPESYPVDGLVIAYKIFGR
jgi:beta-glucanase (GH16 family)